MPLVRSGQGLNACRLLSAGEKELTAASALRLRRGQLTTANGLPIQEHGQQFTEAPPSRKGS